MTDRLSEKFAKIFGRERRIAKALDAASALFTLSGAALFGIAAWAGISETQGEMAAIVAASMCGGMIIGEGARNRVSFVASACFLASCLALFILRFFPEFADKANRIDGNVIFALGLPALVFGICRFFRRPLMLQPLPVDSRSTALHESGHVLSLAVAGSVCVSARMDSDPENGAMGFVKHQLSGSPRQVYAASMLSALGGICAEEALGDGSSGGYYRDLARWDEMARGWLASYGKKATPLVLHMMVHEQEDLLVRHMRRNRDLVFEISDRYREMGSMSQSEVAHYLAKARVSDEMEAWFSESGDEGADEPPLPKETSFSY